MNAGLPVAFLDKITVLENILKGESTAMDESLLWNGYSYLVLDPILQKGDRVIQVDTECSNYTGEASNGDFH